MPKQFGLNFYAREIVVSQHIVDLTQLGDNVPQIQHSKKNHLKTFPKATIIMGPLIPSSPKLY